MRSAALAAVWFPPRQPSRRPHLHRLSSPNALRKRRSRRASFLRLAANPADLRDSARRLADSARIRRDAPLREANPAGVRGDHP